MKTNHIVIFVLLLLPLLGTRNLDSQILDSNYYDKGILQINFKSIDSKYTNNYILDPVDDIKVNGNKRLFLVNVTNNNSDVKTQKSGFALLRIDKNHLIDSSFGKNGIVIIDDDLIAEYGGEVEMMNDGSYIVSARHRNGTSNGSTLFLYKFLINGSLDENFGNNNGTIEIENSSSFSGHILKPAMYLDEYDNTYLAAIINRSIRRFKVDKTGLIDADFTENSTFQELDYGYSELRFFDIIRQGKNHLLYTYQLYSKFFFERTNLDGVIDSSFGVNGIAATSQNVWSSIYAQDSNPILDEDQSIISLSASYIHKNNKDGTIDENFGIEGDLKLYDYLDNGFSRMWDIRQVYNNKWLVSGKSWKPSVMFLLFNNDFSLDTSVHMDNKVFVLDSVIPIERFGKMQLTNKGGALVSISKQLKQNKQGDFSIVKLDSIFNINEINMTKVRLKYPFDESYLDKNETFVTWYLDNMADEYLLEISKNPEFSSIYISVFTSSNHYNVSTLESGIKYYWRVKGLLDEKQSKFSEIRSFKLTTTTSVEERQEIQIKDLLSLDIHKDCIRVFNYLGVELNKTNYNIQSKNYGLKNGLYIISITHQEKIYSFNKIIF